MTDSIFFAILTVSDSCYNGTATDTSGVNLKKLVENSSKFHGVCLNQAIVSDDVQQIKKQLIEWCSIKEIDVVLTTGGTGFAPRDVTPEATKEVIERETPGLFFAMMKGSLEVTPMAMLSRAACGIRDNTLIINFPGSKKGSQENFTFIEPVLKHAVNLLNDNKIAVSKTHIDVQGFGHHCHHSSSKGHNHHKKQSKVDDLHVAERSRSSEYPLVSVTEALQHVLRQSDKLETEVVHYQNSLQRVLAEGVYSTDPLPPFPSSIKDGYAVIAGDGKGIREVLTDSIAGSLPNKEVSSGCCVRVSTGAPVPQGADSVVQVEDTLLTKKSEDGCSELVIEILTKPTIGQDIRPIGSDISAGEKVLSAGTYMHASEVGILAACGITKVTCYKKPTVGIMSTGNELQEPDEELKAGKIRDSNRTTLMAALKENGFNAKDLGIVKDSPEAVMRQFHDAFSKVDIIVTSGGVSMGEKDFLKDVLTKDFDATIHFARVFMKPGKPTTFATVVYEGCKKLVFALPGNPVSSIVTCHLYVIPSLMKISGMSHSERIVVKAKLSVNVQLDPRPEYHRCCLVWEDQSDGIPVAYSTGNQISSRLLSMRSANALLMLPNKTEQQTHLNKGDIVDAMIINKL